MESFPSKAVRAFEKPCNFIYTPHTGSFCITGIVDGLQTSVICGVAATAEDTSDAVSFYDRPVSEVANIVTNEHHLRRELAKSSSPFNSCVPTNVKFYEDLGNIILSDNFVGDFVLEHTKEIKPFVFKDRAGARPHLTRANVSYKYYEVQMVATDAHRLQVIGTSWDLPDLSDDKVFEEISFDVPVSILDALKLSSCLNFDVYEHAVNLTCFSDDYGVVTLSWERDSTSFPPWRSVIPEIDDLVPTNHCVPNWSKIDKSQRKDHCTMCLVQSEDTFVLIDDTEDALIGVGGTSVNLQNTLPLTYVKPRYAWELGKLARKVPTEEMLLFVHAEKAATSPLRFEWDVGNVYYTHVLMPKRVNFDEEGWEKIVEDA